MEFVKNWTLFFLKMHETDFQIYKSREKEIDKRLLVHP